MLINMESKVLDLEVGRDGIKMGDLRKKLVEDWSNLNNISESKRFIDLL